jgi:hypothetical protein
MKNIKLIELDKYSNKSRYTLIEGNIYDDKVEGSHVFALSFELEEGEDYQYPLEDVLDEYSLYVSDFLDDLNSENSEVVSLELAGEIDNIKQAIDAIEGKRIYQEEVKAENGMIYLKLKIE